MHDEKAMKKIIDEVAILEGKKELSEEEIESKKTSKLFDPSMNLKKLEMNKEYQEQLAKEGAAKQAEAMAGIKAEEAAAEKAKASQSGEL